jgi:hypothetical protein
MQDFSEPIANGEHFEYFFKEHIDACWVSLILMITGKFPALNFMCLIVLRCLPS